METPQEKQPELEILENKFYEKETVSWKGDPGWRVDRIAEKDGTQIMEIGKMRKDPKGRDVYERQIAYAHELKEEEPLRPELEVLENKFYEREMVTWKGEPGWKVEKVTVKDGKQILQIGKMKKDRLGREVYVSEIAYPEELEEAGR